MCCDGCDGGASVGTTPSVVKPTETPRFRKVTAFGMPSALLEPVNNTRRYDVKAKSPSQQTPQELLELTRAIAQLPAAHRENLTLLANRVIESTQRRKRILNLVQEALSQLRLDMKYLMFDLEATRRERDALQQQLNDDE